MKLYKDKLLLLTGLAATLFSFIIYNLTTAPTVSFWDCGEFIASSYILGVPHPPGTPLYILLGRVFTLLPLPFNYAVRVNFMSVIFSAASVFMAYWLIIRLSLDKDEQKLSLMKRVALSIGGFSGSLIMGFSSTYWDNAIEAEVYGPAMFLMLVLCYLLLLWSNKIGKPASGKYLAAISFLSFLSVGIHLAAFMVMPIIILYMLVKDRSLLTDFRFVITWIVLLTITISFTMFFWGMISLIVILAIAVFSRTKNHYRWLLAFAIAVAASIGYSTHVYLPIRADEKPAINENNPDNWTRFKGFLDRKQYGQELMISRAMTRRGSWANQLGNHPHMGFGGFFLEQYSTTGVAFLFFAIGAWGIIEAIRRQRINGLWLLTLFLVSTIGLVYYLNFSDGTRGAILEVRNRDYFFTPGFMFFAVFMGIGISGLLQDLADWAGGINFRKIIFIAAAALAITMPIHSLQANYITHDRSRNWIPWDYAYNILNSADKDAILFTNGDNDTFPLWFIQEVEKIRKDVRVINLSLLNTPWYIHQLKDRMGVPINMTYDQIENIKPRWLSDKQTLWRVQDEMIRQIVTANNLKYPIFFALTVASENKMGLEPNMIVEGMAYRLVQDKGEGRVNPELAFKRYMVEFKYRGLGDSTIYKDENDYRLIANYNSGFIQLADTLKNSGQIDKAVAVINKSISINPDDWRTRAYLAGLYAVTGKMDSISTAVVGLNNLDAEKVYINAAQELLMKQAYNDARPLLKQAFKYNPKSEIALKNQIIIEAMTNNISARDSLTQAYRTLFKDNPNALASLDNLYKALERQKKN